MIGSTLEYWAWMLNDLADQVTRLEIHDGPTLCQISKLEQWTQTMGDILFDMKDQKEHLAG